MQGSYKQFLIQIFNLAIISLTTINGNVSNSNNSLLTKSLKPYQKEDNNNSPLYYTYSEKSKPLHQDDCLLNVDELKRKEREELQERQEEKEKRKQTHLKKKKRVTFSENPDIIHEYEPQPKFINITPISTNEGTSANCSSLQSAKSDQDDSNKRKKFTDITHFDVVGQSQNVTGVSASNIPPTLSPKSDEADFKTYERFINFTPLAYFGENKTYIRENSVNSNVVGQSQSVTGASVSNIPPTLSPKSDQADSNKRKKFTDITYFVNNDENKSYVDKNSVNSKSYFNEDSGDGNDDDDDDDDEDDINDSSVNKTKVCVKLIRRTFKESNPLKNFQFAYKYLSENVINEKKGEINDSLSEEQKKEILLEVELTWKYMLDLLKFVIISDKTKLRSPKKYCEESNNIEECENLIGKLNFNINVTGADAFDEIYKYWTLDQLNEIKNFFPEFKGLGGMRRKEMKTQKAINNEVKKKYKIIETYVAYLMDHMEKNSDGTHLKSLLKFCEDLNAVSPENN